ncbi:hypothetical protein Tco_0434568 [Tanacetum coccineum]
MFLYASLVSHVCLSELSSKGDDVYGFNYYPNQEERDEDANDQQSDDERTESDDEQTKTDNPKTSDDEEETQDDEFVHTPEDYVPTDDETNDESNDVTEEEYERINEELYGDVNVSLTDAEHTDKEKDDEEMTVVGHVNVNQEGACNKVKDDAQETQKTEVPLPSSSISSDYAAKFLNFDNIPSADTEFISILDINVQHEVPHTSSLLTIPVFIIPKKDVINQSETKRLRQQYAPQKSIKDIREIKLEHSRKHQVPKETITSSDITTLEEFDQKTTLFETMTKSKSFNKSPKQRALYHALMESILEDEDDTDEGDAEKSKKRKPDDADKDEGPSAGSDRGSAQVEETVFVGGDTQGPQNLREDTHNTNEPPVVNVDQKDWFKKLERPPTLDPEWNEGKSDGNKPTQKWLSNLAKAKKPSRTFDDLMSTLIAILVGPAYNILKGTCRSYVELDYNMEECYKALTDL